MMSKSEVVNLLKVIVQALNQLDESQYEQLLNGKGRIKFIELEPRATDRHVKRQRSLKVNLSDEEMQLVAEQLKICQTRDDARTLLHKNGRDMSKDSLLRLAKFLGVHVNKNDRNNIVEDKIVEFVVGARLRAETIRGLNLKSSTY